MQRKKMGWETWEMDELKRKEKIAENRNRSVCWSGETYKTCRAGGPKDQDLETLLHVTIIKDE